MKHSALCCSRKSSLMTIRTSLNRSIVLQVPQRPPVVLCKMVQSHTLGADLRADFGCRLCSIGPGMFFWVQTVQTLGADCAASGPECFFWVQTCVQQRAGKDFGCRLCRLCVQTGTKTVQSQVQTSVHALTLPSHCVGTTRIYINQTCRPELIQVHVTAAFSKHTHANFSKPLIEIIPLCLNQRHTALALFVGNKDFVVENIA